MQSDERVIVVGSTADYNEIIHRRYGREVLFLTDINESLAWQGYKPPVEDECLSDLTDYETAINNLISHLQIFDKKPIGVICFDCESLPLASRTAVRLGLPFPDEHSIDLCRSKAATHEIWTKHGVKCASSVTVSTTDDIHKAVLTTGLPAVIKPSTGSGSELVFIVNTGADAESKLLFIMDKLRTHENTRMYYLPECTLETYIEGDEYSCDWMLKDGEVRIIRTARKIKNNALSFGTVSDYIVPADRGFEAELVAETLKNGAESLGFKNMLAMTDMIINDNGVYLLEMTPRIGGDCLPDLVLASCGMDMFRTAIDYAKGAELNIPSDDKWKPLCAHRIIADRDGVFEYAYLDDDDREILIRVARAKGHVITVPPENYDSRIIGHVIFAPYSDVPVEEQVAEITEKTRIMYR